MPTAREVQLAALDHNITQLVKAHGLSDCIGALARWAHRAGEERTFRRLNQVYELVLAASERASKRAKP